MVSLVHTVGGARTATVTDIATAMTSNALTAQQPAEALPTMATGITVSLSTTEQTGMAAGTATERRTGGTTAAAGRGTAAGMPTQSRGSRKRQTARQKLQMARSAPPKGSHLPLVASLAVEQATGRRAMQA